MQNTVGLCRYLCDLSSMSFVAIRKIEGNIHSRLHVLLFS